jgi:broad specificity phosphatase PhoE
VTRIILVRHGHVEGIEPQRFRGHRDLPLTGLGQAQAEAVARRVARCFAPQQVYTSPLARCIATGAAIARACGLVPQTLPSLIDIDYGAWEFLSFDEARRLDPVLFAAWFDSPQRVRFPEGESLRDLADRAAETVRLLVARHPEQTVVAVAHDSVNRAMLVGLLDMPLSAYWRLAQDPCCINEIEIDHARILVRRINETQHLDGIG